MRRRGNWSQTATAFQEIASGLRSAADECGAFDEGLADVVNRAADVTAGVGTLIAAIHGIGAAVSSVEKASAILMGHFRGHTDRIRNLLFLETRKVP